MRKIVLFCAVAAIGAGAHSAFSCDGSTGVAAWCAYTVTQGGVAHKNLVAWDWGDGCGSFAKGVNLYQFKGNSVPIVGYDTVGGHTDPYSPTNEVIDMAQVAKTTPLALPSNYQKYGNFHDHSAFFQQLATDQDFLARFKKTGISPSAVHDGYSEFTTGDGYSATIFWNDWVSVHMSLDWPDGLGGWMTLPSGETVQCEAIPHP